MSEYIGLAIAGSVLVAVGFALWWGPAGIIVAGLEMLVGAYVGAYFEARKQEREEVRRR